MSNTNDNGDGRNTPDGRVYTRFTNDQGPAGSSAYPGSGSIYEIAAQQGISTEGAHIGGLYSGLTAQEHADIYSRGGDGAIRATSGGPPNLGGYTATNSLGDPITNANDLRPDSLVTVNTPHGPITTDYANAVAAGLLSPQQALQSGRQQEQQARQDEQQQQDQENTGDMDKHEDAVPMDAQAEALMRDALDRDHGAVVQASSDLIETGVVGDDMIARLAAPGENPEQVNAKVQTAIEGYRGDAVRGAARHAGTDEALAYEALMASAGTPAMKKAMHDHVQRGGTRQYSQFVRDHVASIAEAAPQRILTAQCAPGISVREDGGGQIVVTIDGQNFRWQDAVQQGLIRVGSGRRR